MHTKAFADVSVNFDNFFRLYEFSSVVITQQELSKKKCRKPFPYVLKHKEISLKKLKQLNYLFLADKKNLRIKTFHISTSVFDRQRIKAGSCVIIYFSFRERDTKQLSFQNFVLLIFRRTEYSVLPQNVMPFWRIGGEG